MIYLNDPSLEGTQNIPIDNKDVMDCLAGQFGVSAPSFAFSLVYLLLPLPVTSPRALI